METREGTCPWCEREGQTLGFIVWYFLDQVFTDWVCERCRRTVSATVDERED